MKIFHTFLRNIPLILIMSVFAVDSAFSAEACVIKSGMGKELSTYIRTVDALRARLETEAVKKQCGSNGSESASAKSSKTTSAIIGSMNESIGFSNFYTSGRFYVDLALESEIPFGITRDHEQLGKEIGLIKNTIEIVHSQCAEDTVLDSNLSDDPLYNTSGKTFGVVLREVLQNQIEMMNFYRATVLGDDTSESTFILVGDSKKFRSDFVSHYGPDAYGRCNGESDFFKNIKDAFGRITTLGGSIETGMDEWERASALLNSNSASREYAETERNVLRAELGRQGVSTKTSQATLNCLSHYNSTGLRCGIVGGLTNVVTTVNDNKDAIVRQFEETYATLKAMLTKPQTTDKYMETLKAINALKVGINTDIVADYTNTKNLIGPENLSVDETLGNLIDTHIILESTNMQVKSYVKISEQTCNAQSRGEGNCTFR